MALAVVKQKACRTSATNLAGRSAASRSQSKLLATATDCMGRSAYFRGCIRPGCFVNPGAAVPDLIRTENHLAGVFNSEYIGS